MPGLMLGVGTIKNLQQAEDYMKAGADFLVSPGFVPEVASLCRQQRYFLCSRLYDTFRDYCCRKCRN